MTHNAGFSHPPGWDLNLRSLVRQADALHVPTEPTRRESVFHIARGGSSETRNPQSTDEKKVHESADDPYFLGRILSAFTRTNPHSRTNAPY